MEALENAFNISLQNRKILHKFLKDTPRDLLLRIPNGYRNNIWWNMAHVVVTQQLLIYKLGGQPMRVDSAIVEKFQKGTVPDGTATEAEINEITDLLLATVEWAQQDYAKGIFTAYQEYTTSANVTLKKVEDAILFNVFHEGIHLGTILSLQKALKLAEA
ncbi:DinB family protein [Arenibacter certesii]|uniref:DinB-like domain-containing protein n=1 Tax=Arenibacter certesii TaxID=228955 RepID=A0A918IP95_9FLAO|nr:DinB family protein [Arenibacter certesii]GGW25152.1 hypothetical protein GCM10007383_07550 [Arenibacter certesii]